MPKNILNDSKKLKKSRKRLFDLPQRVKNDPSKWQKWAYFWSKILISGVIYQHFVLKSENIDPKLGLLRPKTMHEHFLNKSKKLRKSQVNDFFYPQNFQNTGVKLAKSVNLCVDFRYTSSIFQGCLFTFLFHKIYFS